MPSRYENSALLKFERTDGRSEANVPSQLKVKQEDLRFRLLRLLSEDPELSQRELAAAVGVSTGRIHYLLSALVETGLIKLGNFRRNPDKRRYAYILTPRGVAEKAAITQRFLARKRAEYEALREEIEELQGEIGGQSQR